MTQLLNAIPGALAQGLIWGVMAIGVYITYKVLDIADLTVDGSLCTGAAVCTMLLLAGHSPWIAMLCAVLAGLLAGTVTGLLHVLLGIPPILAGILTQMVLWSVNLKILGKANQALPARSIDVLLTQMNIPAALPVLLVVQPKGASITLAAELRGLLQFRTPSHIVGILLNDCSEALYKTLRPMLEAETGLPVVGYLPHLPGCAIESRHLGLKTAGEISDLQQKLGKLADALVLDWAQLAVLTDRPAPAAPPQREAPPASAQEVSAAQPQPEPKPEYTADPALNKPRKVAAEGINPFPQWAEVIKLLQEQDPMLYTYLKKSKGYFDGTRVLIDGGKTFRDFIRANKESQKLIKKLIAQVSGVAVPIGPYESKTVNRASANAEESLRKLEQLGLEVSIEDSERKKR